MDAITSIHRSSLDTRLAPCSARKPRSASSSLIPAVTAAAPASGGSCPGAQRPVHRLGQVGGAAAERVGQVVADHRGGAPRPEQDADHQAHQAADGHVLDAQQAHPPAGRREQVEQDQHDHGERRLAEGERQRARRVGGHGHRDGQRRPQRRGAGADAEQQQCAQHEAEHGAAQRAQRGGLGRRRVGAQHRQGAEDHPEPVLDPGQVGHQDRRGQGQRPAQAVQEPDRTEAGVPGQDAHRAGDRGRPPLRHGPFGLGAVPAEAPGGDRLRVGPAGGDQGVRHDVPDDQADRLGVEGVPGDDLHRVVTRLPFPLRAAADWW